MYHDARYHYAGVMSLPGQLHFNQQQMLHCQQFPQQHQQHQLSYQTLLNTVEGKERYGYGPAKCQPTAGRNGFEDRLNVARTVFGRREVGAAGNSCCCVPTGCTRYNDDPIDPVDPGDAVRVMCNNPGCTVGRWMHADCFEEWDRRASYYRRLCDQEASCRFNNATARLVLAGEVQVRMCICGKGFLSKDPNYVPPPFNTTKKYFGTSSRSPIQNNENGTNTELASGLVRHLQQLHLQQEQQQQRLRSCSFSSTGSGSCSSGSSSSVGGGSSSCGYSSTSATPPLSPPRSFFPASSATAHASTPPPVVSSLAMKVAAGRGGSASSTGDDSGIGLATVATNLLAASSSGIQVPPQPSQPRQHALHQHHHRHHQQHGAAVETAEATAQPVAADKPQPNARGNIFRHRGDLSVYRAIRPSVRNAYCIQLDDDGPHGNNDTRKFLMHKLTASGVSAFQCVSCRRSLPVYDEFPVVDGTLFLSPRPYDAATDGQATSGRLSVQVVYNRRMLHLHAVCLDCLSQTVVPVGPSATAGASAPGAKGGNVGDAPRPRSVRCRACRRPWALGSTLVLGTMYSYDVFACAPCCADRQRCRRCGQRPTGGSGDEPKSFSDFSKLSSCVHCGLEDYHYVRPFDESFFCCYDDVVDDECIVTPSATLVPKVLQRQS